MNYLSVISERDQAWADAARQTTYVEPRKLSSSDWDLIELANQESTIVKFADAMPMKIGQFKPDMRDEVLARARQLKYRSRGRAGGAVEGRGDQYYADRTAEIFLRDMNFLHSVMFDRSIDYCATDIGKFDKGGELSPELHVDDTFCSTNDYIYTCTYLARIGALPFEVIARAGFNQATPEQLELITKACVYGNDRRPAFPEAINQLRKDQLLKPVPLDDVMMLLSRIEKHGTWHISGPIPPEGAVSAFFSAAGPLKVRPNLDLI